MDLGKTAHSLMVNITYQSSSELDMVLVGSVEARREETRHIQHLEISAIQT